MEIIHSFHFENNFIFEVHFLDRDYAPKSIRYKWYLYFGQLPVENAMITLTFQKMMGPMRLFTDGTIIDMELLYLRYKDKDYPLGMCTKEDNDFLINEIKERYL